MKQWRATLTELLKEQLPGERVHRTMLPPQRELFVPEINQHSVRISGVLMVIFPQGNELYSCLIKRSAHLNIHAGQIGFPGGKLEPQDITPDKTALRETYEEIGLCCSEKDIIGKLTPLYVSVSNFMIYPYVAWSDKTPRFKVNTLEVDKLFYFPLLENLQTSYTSFREVETVSGKMTVPGFMYHGEFIWGATAMILAEFLEVLSGAANTSYIGITLQ